MSDEAGVVGGVVVVPLAHPAAHMLERALRHARREAHRNGLPFDVRLTVLIDHLANSRSTQSVPRPAPTLGATGSAGGALDRAEAGFGGAAPALNTTTVAELAGVSERAVRKAASAGHLVGERGRHGWEFTAAAVHRWRHRRGKQ